MERIKHTFENNARLLKSNVNRFACIGLAISIVAITLGSLAVAFQSEGHITVDALVKAQTSNVALWILDLTPILFMFWGQSISSVIPYTANAMVIDQKHELRLQTNELTSSSEHVTFYHEHGKDAPPLIQWANPAIYHAKQANKEFAAYKSSVDKDSPNSLTLMSELKKAIDGEQLLVYYQPKVDLKTKKIKGCEALLKWEHPTFGMMSAEKFIPVAERTGLIKFLSLYVLKQTIEQASRWYNKGYDIEVAINLSAVDIIDIELPYTIQSLLNVYDLPGRYITIELIESTNLSDQSRAVEVITKLAGLGIKISIDDFGTGYSSFVYLNNLPIHEIKIDKSFIMTLHENDKKRSIVNAIIKLANALKLSVVAEGVEKLTQVKILSELQCPVVQGYYFSEAINANAFEQLVVSGEQLPIKN